MDYPDLLLFTNAMIHAGRLNSYRSLKWTHNWYADDTFDIVVNRNRTNVDSLAEGGFIGFPSTLGDGGWNIGCVDSIQKVQTRGKSSELWTASGRGVESVLQKRRCLHAWATGDGYDTQVAEAELNMRHYVDVEVINPTDTDRAMAGITLESVHSPELGAVIEYKARMQELPEVLYDHCKQAGLSFGLVWSGTGVNFLFSIYAGTDRSTGVTKVTLSANFGNVKEYDYLYSTLDQRNLVYVGGAGDGAARTLVDVHSGATPTGWNREETFVDALECTETDELTAKGNQVLAERGATQTLDFTFKESPSFTIGTDFFLGDTVEVEFPDVATMISRITKITERYDRNGRNYEIGVGKSKPDFVSILKAQNKKINRLSTR